MCVSWVDGVVVVVVGGSVWTSSAVLVVGGMELLFGVFVKGYHLH